MFKVHKEAHYKNGTGTTPVKKMPTEDEIEAVSYNEDEEIDNEMNEEGDETETYDNNDNNAIEIETNDASEEKMNYSMTQDDFIEDGSVARVI